jgi:hypothetical protein
MHKIVDIKFSGHNTFLGLPSAGTLKIKRWKPNNLKFWEQKTMIECIFFIDIFLLRWEKRV